MCGANACESCSLRGGVLAGKLWGVCGPTERNDEGVTATRAGSVSGVHGCALAAAAGEPGAALRRLPAPDCITRCPRSSRALRRASSYLQGRPPPRALH